MYALKIRDQVRWHDHWSSEIGKRLQVLDSTNDLYVFDPSHSREEILAVIAGAPEELFDLFQMEESPQENCDYMADSGRCYSRL